ncbi:hypothetical protein ACIA8E_34630 [Streptomyces sp. NPDC051664]|uniref:hypothetical protein n=1 Tax=Streptomyces sp. NPDC051664 TaxID=3365668 RepID=UPI0037A93E5E
MNEQIAEIDKLIAVAFGALALVEATGDSRGRPGDPFNANPARPSSRRQLSATTKRP